MALKIYNGYLHDGTNFRDANTNINVWGDPPENVDLLLLFAEHSENKLHLIETKISNRRNNSSNLSDGYSFLAATGIGDGDLGSVYGKELIDSSIAARLFCEMGNSKATETMNKMDSPIASEILSEMDCSASAEILSEMDYSAAVEALSKMTFRAKLGVFIVCPMLHCNGLEESKIKYLRSVGELIGIKPLCFKGQIVLQGPPGTGKSYSAKQIARALTNQSDSGYDEKKGYWQVVQFHPSYNYEDFVRGIQVRTGPGAKNENKEETEQSGQVQYQTVNRIFAKMCKSAEANPTEPYVLIIDEMNRANLPSVLGELIYGLEYRGEEVQTPYEVNSSKGLTVPENLFVIGTMNTADRSIGHIDYAIRRRFAFIDVLPSEDTVKDHYEDGSGLRDKAQGYFNAVGCLFENSLSGEYEREHVQIGHSYFMASTEDELNLKIQYEVLPILREYMQDGILDETKGSLKEHLESWDAFKQFLSPAKEDELGEGK